MSNTVKPLLAPNELKALYPLTPAEEQLVKDRRETVRGILTRQDPRHLLILGPCSIHDTTEALEYASKLKALSEEVSGTFFLVMRVYFEKPRSGLGWKGLLHDPLINGLDNIEMGLKITRSLLVDIHKMGIPIASEFLDPLSIYYLADLVSWGSIGARTPESQVHRQFVSGLDFPVAFKNSTSGCILAAISGIRVASQSHSYIGIHGEGGVCSITTNGNPDTHLVLRGGKEGPNYHQEAVENAIDMLKEYNIDPRLIIDCSHGNSSKVHTKQPEIMRAVVKQITDGISNIRGIMLESNLHEGSQSQPNKYGVSITDACMSWEVTKEIILEARDQLSLFHNNTQLYATKR